MSTDDVATLLQASVSSDELVQQIKENGYTGLGDVATLKKLKDNGASAALLTLIRQQGSTTAAPSTATPPPAPAPQPKSNPIQPTHLEDESGFDAIDAIAMAARDPWTNSVAMRMIHLYNDEGTTFFLADTEVTQAQWKAVMGNNPSHFQGDNRPVEKVSWHDAMAFCQRLTEMERAAGKLRRGYIYTLPTSKQWDGAFKYDEGKGNFPATLGDVAWYQKNSGEQTSEAAKKEPNSKGFYDLHGNVWEWCLDSVGSYRVGRGGSWSCPAKDCSSSATASYDPRLQVNDVGFRPAFVQEK